MKTEDIIYKLKNSKLYAECSCGGEFKLSDVLLFDGTKPFPPARAGAFSALGIYSLFKLSKNEKITLQGAAISMAAGGLFGMAPDILEPPTNPNHRSFFHSLTFLILLSAGNQKMWKSNSIPEDLKQALSIMYGAYGSHLISDATTKKGLPILL